MAAWMAAWMNNLKDGLAFYPPLSLLVQEPGPNYELGCHNAY